MIRIIMYNILSIWILCSCMELCIITWCTWYICPWQFIVLPQVAGQPGHSFFWSQAASTCEIGFWYPGRDSMDHTMAVHIAPPAQPWRRPRSRPPAKAGSKGNLWRADFEHRTEPRNSRCCSFFRRQKGPKKSKECLQTKECVIQTDPFTMWTEGVTSWRLGSNGADGPEAQQRCSRSYLDQLRQGLRSGHVEGHHHSKADVFHDEDPLSEDHVAIHHRNPYRTRRLLMFQLVWDSEGWKLEMPITLHLQIPASWSQGSTWRYRCSKLARWNMRRLPGWLPSKHAPLESNQELSSWLPLLPIICHLLEYGPNQ